jgi:ribonuclease-3
MSYENLKPLQRKIGYVFKDESLLNLALTHRSFSSQNNERLEFLGDAVLSLFIAEALFQKFPKAKEGQLSRLRSSLVKGVTLAQIGIEFNLGDFLNLGQGELKSGGFRRESIISDAFEAIVGAIYLDSNDDICRGVVLSWYEDRLSALTLENTEKDPKTRLQEYLQSIKKDLPVYDVYDTQGEAHDQEFFVTCQIEALDIVTRNKGPSRRVAEQKAAKEALKKLGVK